MARLFGGSRLPTVSPQPTRWPIRVAHASAGAATTDALFTCQSRRVAQRWPRRQSEPVYRYLFDHTLANDPAQQALGAVHTIEHAFLFGWDGDYRPTAADLAVQRLMVARWTQLARDGQLDPSRAVAWPVVQPGERFLRIAAASSSEAGDAGARCSFWDDVTLPWPHL